jgi:hypothetical protein
MRNSPFNRKFEKYTLNYNDLDQTPGHPNGGGRGWLWRISRSITDIYTITSAKTGNHFSRAVGPDVIWTPQDPQTQRQT